MPHEKAKSPDRMRLDSRAGGAGQGGEAGAHHRGLTLVEQGRVLAQGPQRVEGTEPPQHCPQRGRHAALVRVLVELPHHRELQERQGQGTAVVHLKTKHSTEPPIPVSRQLEPRYSLGGEGRWKKPSGARTKVGALAHVAGQDSDTRGSRARRGHGMGITCANTAGRPGLLLESLWAAHRTGPPGIVRGWVRLEPLLPQAH